MTVRLRPPLVLSVTLFVASLAAEGGAIARQSARAGDEAPAACLPLAPRSPHGNYLAPGGLGDVVYRTVDGHALALDAWAPAGVARAPAVVVVHGGGFTAGSRVAHVGQFLDLLTRAGYGWVSIDYRLGGRERADAAAGDLRAALDFVRCRAAELRLDADRLVLLGEDSGAAIVAAVAAGAPAGVVGAVLAGGSYDHAGAAPTGVPLFVLHGGDDREAPPAQARAFCDAVRAAGGRCDAEIVDGASHRVENWWPVHWPYKARLKTWLDDRLGGGAPGPHLPARTVDRLPARLGPGLHKEIVYSPVHGLALDAFLPPADRAPGPAVVIVHGGGWEAGDKVTYITPLFEPLAKAGLAWFSIDYRLTPDVRHPAQLEDVETAVRFIRAHAARFGVDPRRVVLVGESASGQMVMQVAARDPSLAGVVSFYGVYDFTSMVTDASPRSLLVRLFGRTTLDDEARAVLTEYSPYFQASKAMPPVLLIHGTDERLWEQGTRMAGRLSSLGARHELIAVEGAPHGVENWEGRPDWLGYKDALVAWIRRVAL